MNVFCSTPQMGKRYSTIPFDTTLQSKQMETIGESLYPKRSTKIFLFSSFLAFPYGAIFRLFQFLDNIAYAIIRQCLTYDVLLSSTKGYRRKGLKSLVFSHRMILVLFHPWRHERDASYRGQSVFIVVFAADLFH